MFDRLLRADNPARKPRGLIALCFCLLAIGVQPAQAEGPQRIISLAPHLTEAVFWLGADSRLLGRDRFSNYPQQALDVPVVGDAYSLNIEALAALKPDLVLLWQAPQALKQQLEQLQMPIFDTNPQSLEQIAEELQRLARLLEIPAKQQFSALRQDIELLAKHAGNTQQEALILVQQQPPVALGMGDSLAVSLQVCGWQNALSQSHAVVDLSPEYLWVGHYDAIIDFTQQSKSYQQKRILRPDADPLVRPGPRFPAALNKLCEQLNS